MKYKIFLFLALFCTIAFSPQAHSQTLSLTPSLYFFNYKEFGLNNDLLDKETGPLAGIKLGIERQLNHSVFRVHGALHAGDVDYDGQTQMGDPHKTDTRTVLINSGVKLLSRPGPEAPAAVFFGMQYWYWDRDILTRNNVLGLHEIYTWFEAELGLRLETRKQQNAYYWAELSALYILSPEMEIRLPNSSETLDLGSEPGFRINLGHSWIDSSNTHLSLNIFAEYWEFGRSNAVFTTDFFGSSAFIVEPRSETLHSGIQLSLNYLF